MEKIIEYIKSHAVLLIGIYALVMTIVLGISAKSCSRQVEEIDRLSENQVALINDLDEYRTKDGKSAARIMQLELTKSEFEKLCDEQAATIKNLRLKVKNLESITSTATQTIIDMEAKLKDTTFVYIRDSIIVKDSVKMFAWKDAWNSISGEICGDNISCKYHGEDTLTVAATRVPKKFLFIPYGVKYIQVDVMNRNEASHIVYNESIRLKK